MQKLEIEIETQKQREIDNYPHNIGLCGISFSSANEKDLRGKEENNKRRMRDEEDILGIFG